MATIGTLTANLTLESGSFISNLNKSASAMQQSARSIEQQSASMSTAMNNVGSAASTLRTGLAAVGVGFSIQAVSGFVQSTFAAADALKAASDTAGISAEALQRWRFAAEQSGVGAGTMDIAIKTLNERLGDFARSGTGPAAKALQDLGVAAKVQSGELQGTTAIMEAVVNSLASIEDPARQASISTDLFGRSAGPQMAGLLKEGVDGIQALRQATAVLTNEQVARADEIGDRWAKMTGQLKTTLQSAVLTLTDFAARGAENNSKVADAYERTANDVIASVTRMATEVDNQLNNRLSQATEQSATVTIGLALAWKKLYDDVVGRSYVPDMVTEIQGWMERLEGDAMADPARRAIEETNKSFEEFSSGAFENALDDMATSFNRVFEQMLVDGVTSFDDLAEAAQRSFVSMASTLGEEMGKVFAPQLGRFGAAAGPLGSIFGSAGAIGAQAGAQALFGSAGGATNTGSSIGGMLGLGVGSAFGPAGGIAGGLLGTFLGGGIGSLFGGGSQSNRVNISGGFGAGAGGTGAAAQFVQGIDAQLQNLLNSAQEATADRILKVAEGIRVEYSKQLSANDMARLTAGRIGPVAQSLGLNAGAVTQGNAEQQIANLQTAIQTMRALESIRIGNLGTQLRDINDHFQELSASAIKYGIPLEGLAQAHQRAAEAAIRQNRAEFLGIAQQVGAVSPLIGALELLSVQMQEAAARAIELGVPLQNLAATHIALAQAIYRQNRAREVETELGVGNITPLHAELLQLNLRFQELYANARQLGVATGRLAQSHIAAAQAVIRQHRIESITVAEQVGAMTPLQASLERLNVEMQAAYAAAQQLGISTANISARHRELANALIEQAKATVEVTKATQEQVDTLALSITNPFEELLEPLRQLGIELNTSLMNPLEQFNAAAQNFRNVAHRAFAGSTEAIAEFDDAARGFIQTATQVGASPGQVAAIREVESARQFIVDQVGSAQAQAGRGVESAIAAASRREVDTLRELIEVGQQQIVELRRLTRNLT